ncbi:MAG: GNAT family N-acetyltransferase [Anaerolineaceae bacterium]|nr:GNAT family N-acetyltransferase [Anaerolineaceae bacterium]
MKKEMRLCTKADVEAIVALGLLAWEPVFESFENIMGPTVFPIIYPDWKKTQREEMEKVCKEADKFDTYVTEVAGKVVGFMTLKLDQEIKKGEIYFLAVHPDAQNEGIGTALNHFAVQKMKEASMKFIEVGTGGDPSHAPARRSYEKAGFKRALPVVKYYMDLTEEN